MMIHDQRKHLRQKTGNQPLAVAISAAKASTAAKLSRCVADAEADSIAIFART